MKALDQYIGELRPKQSDAIVAAIDNSDGEEWGHVVGFVSMFLMSIVEQYENTPVEWVAVTAHLALLKMAQNEGILPDPGRLGRRPGSKYYRMQADLDEALLRIAYLQGELSNSKLNSGKEIFALRLEIQLLNNRLAEVRSLARRRHLLAKWFRWLTPRAK